MNAKACLVRLYVGRGDLMNWKTSFYSSTLLTVPSMQDCDSDKQRPTWEAPNLVFCILYIIRGVEVNAYGNPTVQHKWDFLKMRNMCKITIFLLLF